MTERTSMKLTIVPVVVLMTLVDAVSRAARNEHAGRGPWDALVSERKASEQILRRKESV
jgi:hypothetical protein